MTGQNQIGSHLKQAQPIDTIVATCEACGFQLYHSAYEDVGVLPNLAGELIEVRSKTHNERTGHDALDIAVTKTPKHVDEVDAQLTVGESE